jgi:hypothetical protein
VAAVLVADVLAAAVQAAAAKAAICSSAEHTLPWLLLTAHCASSRLANALAWLWTTRQSERLRCALRASAAASRAPANPKSSSPVEPRVDHKHRYRAHTTS